MAGQEVTNQLPLDTEISELCDAAQTWLMMAATVAWQMGTTLPLGIVAICRAEAKRIADEKENLEAQGRIHTGYLPKRARINIRHRGWCDGLGPLVAR